MSIKVPLVIGRNSKKGTKQVVPVTPKQKVIKQYGSKEALVDALIALYDAPEGSKARLKQVSNSKLMTHFHNTQRLMKQFGSRAAAVDAILSARFPKGGVPDGERDKLLGYNPWRLMDLVRQATGKAK